MADLDLVHDKLFHTTARVTLRGEVLPVMEVTYYVGTHGPFSDKYDEMDATAENINAGFQRRVDTLKATGGI